MQFTHEHEWIDYNGTVGFVGASKFKLKGIEKIDSIKWYHRKGTIEKGTLIAEIHAEDAVIPIHAPVKCKFLGQNQKLNENLNLILESPQDSGWVFFVTPSKFLNNDTLLSAEEYQKLISTSEVFSDQ
jgi:Glycine cleavage system H protein (lipoate-binding)